MKGEVNALNKMSTKNAVSTAPVPPSLASLCGYSSSQCSHCSVLTAVSRLLASTDHLNVHVVVDGMITIFIHIFIIMFRNFALHSNIVHACHVGRLDEWS